MRWRTGRGRLGRLAPLLGDWRTIASKGDGRAADLICTRRFEPFGKGWVMLDARWQVALDREYREIALFGVDGEGALTVNSFTNDGKQSLGRAVDGSGVHAEAIAFEAQMPAGVARMVYWPLDEDEPGFWFAVESRTQRGWNRFLSQRYGPAG